MINPEKELFKWGPIDGRIIYIDMCNQAMAGFPEYVGGTWPDLIFYCENDKIVYVTDDADLKNRGEELFRKYVLNESELKKRYELWVKEVNRLKEFEKRINKGISNISDEKLKKLFIEWDKLYMDFWVKSFISELSNWGGEQMLKREILKFNKINFIEIFEKLAAPEDLSFFQKEELELMKIKLIKDKRKQLEKLKKHRNNYYWLRNDYGHTSVLDIDYFKNELDKISEEDANKKIEEIEDYIKNVKNNKKNIIKKYKIDKKIAYVGEKLGFTVWWQDLRKKYIFTGSHIISRFLKEISKRKKIDFDELCYYRHGEIVDLLVKDKKIDAKQRYNGFLVYYHERKGIDYTYGKAAHDFVAPYMEVKVDLNTKEFKGLVVSRGVAKGNVKILHSPKNLRKMNKGNILVAPMTSPDYIVAIKKAAAIVTDEGGMTCHAAIVSREMQIPCIVGTKIATKVLKDNDLVEVNADKGIVRKIK